MLTLICVIGMFMLAWFKDVDIMSTLPLILGIFIGSKSFEKASTVYSASKDGTCDTHAVIRELEGIERGSSNEPEVIQEVTQTPRKRK